VWFCTENIGLLAAAFFVAMRVSMFAAASRSKTVGLTAKENNERMENVRMINILWSNFM
jgi:hypothetical protein